MAEIVVAMVVMEKQQLKVPWDFEGRSCGTWKVGGSPQVGIIRWRSERSSGI